MKKLIMVLTLCLISVCTFACHVKSSEICGTTLYLHFELLGNENFQLRFYGDTTIQKSFTTGMDSVIDSTITLQVPLGSTDVKVQFRNKPIDNPTYDYWLGNYNDSANLYYEANTVSSACGVLAVSTNSLIAQKNDANSLIINFKAGDETGVSHYNISLFDGHSWTMVKSVPATGKSSYTATILIAGGVFGSIFSFIGIALYNDGKKRIIGIALLSIGIILFSCTKNKSDLIKTTAHYNSVKVETISNQNIVLSTLYKPIN